MGRDSAPPSHRPRCRSLGAPGGSGHLCGQRVSLCCHRESRHSAGRPGAPRNTRTALQGPLLTEPSGLTGPQLPTRVGGMGVPSELKVGRAGHRAATVLRPRGSLTCDRPFNVKAMTPLSCQPWGFWPPSQHPPPMSRWASEPEEDAFGMTGKIAVASVRGTRAGC